MALENNLVVDSDAELKAFLSSILSSEGIVVNINRTFIAYNNGTNRNRVFARCANRMAQKGTDEKFVVIALMCYPALNWILKARDIDAMIEQLHDMDTDGSVRNISEIQSLLENSTGYVKPRLHLEMRKLFFARCQQLVDAVDDAMNRAVFRITLMESSKILRKSVAKPSRNWFSSWLPMRELSRALKLLISITTQRYCFVNIPVSRIRQALTETVPCA